MGPPGAGWVAVGKSVAWFYWERPTRFPRKRLGVGRVDCLGENIARASFGVVSLLSRVQGVCCDARIKCLDLGGEEENNQQESWTRGRYILLGE